MEEPGEDQWREEAEAVMADIRDHVESVSISTRLHNTCKRAYINVTTFEKNDYCVELTGFGFRIAGFRHDTADADGGTIFETPYSLLDSVSPMYRESFGKSLELKLKRLQEDES